MRRWLSFVFCCVSVAQAPSQADFRPLVTIDSGTLEGAHFGAVANEVMFLGIPYAAPPTGERRWTPPQPVEKWQGTRKANAYGAACPQVDDPWTEALAKEIVQGFEPYFTYHTDEDCLYLNVFTTNLPRDRPAAKKLPVMFWIHGGGGILDAVRQDRRSQRHGSSAMAGLRSQNRHGAGNRARGKTAANSSHRPLRGVRADTEPQAGNDSA